MCGRFALRAANDKIAAAFELQETPLLNSRHNIAPSQPIAVVRQAESGQRELVWLRWGLIPAWAKDAKIAFSTINARAETVAEKPAFRQAFRKRRCLILLDGFYEWPVRNGKKQPHFIHMRNDEPFAVAGLWERWDGESPPLESCSMIVTAANEVLKPIHDRMPVILHPADYDRWLDPSHTQLAELQSLLQPYPGTNMEAYPIQGLSTPELATTSIRLPPTPRLLWDDGDLVS